MDMLKGEQIAEANLTDWRKLGQGLHARYVVDDFGAGVRFVAAVGVAKASLDTAEASLASAVLAVTPGPGVLYIVARTLSQGRRAGLASVAGVGLPMLVSCFLAWMLMRPRTCKKSA